MAHPDRIPERTKATVNTIVPLTLNEARVVDELYQSTDKPLPLPAYIAMRDRFFTSALYIFLRKEGNPPDVAHTKSESFVSETAHRWSEAQSPRIAWEFENIIFPPPKRNLLYADFIVVAAIPDRTVEHVYRGPRETRQNLEALDQSMLNKWETLEGTYPYPNHTIFYTRTRSYAQLQKNHPTFNWEQAKLHRVNIDQPQPQNP